MWAVFREDTNEAVSPTDPEESGGDIPEANPEEPQGDEGSSDSVTDGRDGNNDGIADELQDHVVSLKTSSGKYYVTVESSPGTLLRDCVAVDRPSDAEGLPSEGDYPYGFFSFVVDNVEVGGETQVRLYLPDDAAPTNYYKFGPEPENPEAHWYEFAYDDSTKTGAEIDGNRITMYFIDGEKGDDDLEANGSIVDDGGPRTEEQESGAQGGCFINTLAVRF